VTLPRKHESKRGNSPQKLPRHGVSRPGRVPKAVRGARGLFLRLGLIGRIEDPHLTSEASAQRTLGRSRLLRIVHGGRRSVRSRFEACKCRRQKIGAWRQRLQSSVRQLEIAHSLDPAGSTLVDRVANTGLVDKFVCSYDIRTRHGTQSPQ